MKEFMFKQGEKLLKVLANNKRLEILSALQEKAEMNVTELSKITQLSQSSLSQHLAILREEKVVKTRRNAQTIFYSIQSDKALKVLALLENMYGKPYKS